MPQEMIPLELIDPNPWQTRQKENQVHIEELAHSIKSIGLMQVPSARKVGERYELAFGHSRNAAYVLLRSLGINDEFSRMPLNIRELTDEQMAIAAYEENEKRRDLNPVEKAMAMQKMIADFGWTHEMVAEKLHLNRSGVSNMLRILRMPEAVLDSISSGIMPVRSALALLPIYEFTDEDKAKLLDRFSFEADQFESLARNGEINSDSIRDAVERYTNFLRPKQLELEEVSVVETGDEVTTVQSVQIIAADSEGVTPVLAYNENDESLPPLPSAQQMDLVDWNQNEDQEGGEENENHPVNDNRQVGLPDEGESQTQVIEPTKPAVTETEVAAPTEAKKPAQINEVDLAVDPNEIFVSIAWKTRGVVVSWKRPGMAMPKFKFLERLNFKEIPTLLQEIGL